MSIWADINRRSQGLQKRKEDTVEDDIEFLWKKIFEAAGIPADTFIVDYLDNIKVNEAL